MFFPPHHFIERLRKYPKQVLGCSQLGLGPSVVASLFPVLPQTILRRVIREMLLQPRMTVFHPEACRLNPNTKLVSHTSHS
jgi:hypothetical protein